MQMGIPSVRPQFNCAPLFQSGIQFAVGISAFIRVQISYLTPAIYARSLSNLSEIACDTPSSLIVMP
jgi:hypothetical protein